MATPEVDGAVAVRAPMIGTVVTVLVAAGDAVRQGQPVVLVESMKMEHEIQADVSGVVAAVAVAGGETVELDQPLVWLTEGPVHETVGAEETDVDLSAVRADLREVLDRQAM